MFEASSYSDRENLIAQPILREIRDRLRFLDESEWATLANRPHGAATLLRQRRSSAFVSRPRLAPNLSQRALRPRCGRSNAACTTRQQRALLATSWRGSRIWATPLPWW